MTHMFSIGPPERTIAISINTTIVIIAFSDASAVAFTALSTNGSRKNCFTYLFEVVSVSIFKSVSLETNTFSSTILNVAISLFPPNKSGFTS